MDSLSSDQLSIEQITAALRERRDSGRARHAGIAPGGAVRTAQTVEGLGSVWTWWELEPTPRKL